MIPKPTRQMDFESVSEVGAMHVLSKQVSFLVFDPPFEFQNRLQLWSRIVSFAFVHVLEEKRDIVDLGSPVQLLRQRELLLGARTVGRPGWRSPTVVQHEHGIVALLEILVDQLLRAPDAGGRIFPSDGMEHDVMRSSMHDRIPVEQLLEAPALLFQSTGRPDEDAVLGDRSWHRAILALWRYSLRRGNSPDGHGPAR